MDRGPIETTHAAKTLGIAKQTALVAGSVGAVCVVRAALDPFVGDRVPHVLFLAAVAASTRWGGWRAGIGAAVLSTAAGNYWFAPPRGSFSLASVPEQVSVVLFTVAAGIIIWAIANERAARRAVEARDARLLAEISEKHRLEAALADAQRLESVGRLAGGVAHDFNNLLAVILGSAQLLHPRDDDKELVDDLQLAAKRGADLTRQLLSFARKQMMEVRAMTLNEAVEDCVRLSKRIIPEDIRLRTELCAEPWLFEGDPTQVQQVLLNLVTNARDATTSGGSITISTDNVTLDQSFAQKHPEVSPGEYVLLTVADDGEGMPEELRRRIFEPFFSTKAQKGTGLGLAVSYGIVKQLQGHISVQSQPGAGSRFDVYWPRAKPKLLGGPTRAKASERPSSSSLRVLVVEDDELVRTTASRMLEHLGHRVTEAENGAEALRLAQEMEPADVLLTDVVMPWMNGRELGERLREAWPDLVVVYMSGYTENVVLQRGVVEPGVTLLKKPFSTRELTAAFERARRAAERAS